MKVHLEGSPAEIHKFLSSFPPHQRSMFGDPDPGPLPPPSPPALAAGRYLNGTRVEIVDGVTTTYPELYLLPSPGGDIGWNDLSHAIYLV